MANNFGIGDGILLTGSNKLTYTDVYSLADFEALVNNHNIVGDMRDYEITIITASDPDSADDPDGIGPITAPPAWENDGSRYREEETPPPADQNIYQEGYGRDDLNVDTGEAIRFDENRDGVIDAADDNSDTDATTEWGRVIQHARFEFDVELSNGDVINARASVYITEDDDQVLVFDADDADDLNTAMAASESYITGMTPTFYWGYPSSSAALDVTENLNQAQYTSSLTQFCFTAENMIETENGLQPIGDLKIGDRVVTRDNGLQPIKWIGQTVRAREELSLKPRLKPITMSAGSLGANYPEHDLRVSRNHRILLRGPVAQREFGVDEILVEAKFLLNIAGVDVEDDCKGVTFVHICLPNHEIVRVQGAWAETLYLGAESEKILSDEARAELNELFPEFLRETMPFARKVITGAPAREFIHRHVKNNKPVFTELH